MSSVIGPIIPPSIPLVLYALISDTSVGYLFLGGVVPGLLLGAVQSGLIAVVARRRNFPVEKRVPLRELPRVTWEALPALLMPVILLGCMWSGITTPTEAAAVAAAYALLISALLYRSVGTEGHLPFAGVQRAGHGVDRHADRRRAGLQLRHHGGEHSEDPERVSEGHELSPLLFLLFVNILLLVLGCFLEGTTIILVILPVLLPTAQALGIDMVHFGVMCVVNIMIGLVTPPYGLLLFMMTKIADVPLRDMVREVMPFLYVMIGALALIVFVPGLVLWLPRMLGYTG